MVFMHFCFDGFQVRSETDFDLGSRDGSVLKIGVEGEELTETG